MSNIDESGSERLPDRNRRDDDARDDDLRRDDLRGADDVTDAPAKPEQPGEESFAEGEARPDEYPDDERVGRFSEGEEALGDEDPEKDRVGRFSTGEEALGEEDPEKHVEGRFSTGVDDEPPGVDR